MHKIFEQNFYQYITVSLVRKWTSQKRGWKSAYFFTEKQKRKKADKNERKTDTV